MQQPGLTPLTGCLRRNSAGAADLQYDAQENTPLVGAAKQQDQQQDQQLHSSSYLWQQFRSPPPTMQQRHQDEVRHLDLVYPVLRLLAVLSLWGMLPVRSLDGHPAFTAPIVVAMRLPYLLLMLVCCLLSCASAPAHLPATEAGAPPSEPFPMQGSAAGPGRTAGAAALQCGCAAVDRALSV
jgi:hypothetical protein